VHRPTPAKIVTVPVADQRRRIRTVEVGVNFEFRVAGLAHPAVPAKCAGNQRRTVGVLTGRTIATGDPTDDTCGGFDHKVQCIRRGLSPPLAGSSGPKATRRLSGAPALLARGRKHRALVWRRVWSGGRSSTTKAMEPARFSSQGSLCGRSCASQCRRGCLSGHGRKLLHDF